MTAWWAIGLMVIASFSTALGALLLRMTAHKSLWQPKTLLILSVGVTLYIISSALTIIAYYGGALHIIYPLTSLSYIWTSLIGITLLHEKISLKIIIGNSLVFLGIILITI